MAVKAPQSSLFDIAQKYYKDYLIATVAAFIISIVLTLITSFNIIISNIYWIKEILDLSSLLLIIILFTLERCYKNAIDNAEDERRKVLFDHAFNKKYSRVNSKGYFDTDEIQFGMKKLLANIHQSSLYTNSIVSEMQIRQGVIVAFGCLVMAACAYIGLRNIMISPVVLEFFLSFAIIGRWLDLRSLSNKSYTVEKDARRLWEQINQVTIDDIIPEILDILLRYETELASAKIILNQKIKDQQNTKLEGEWENIKKRYLIQ